MVFGCGRRGVDVIWKSVNVDWEDVVFVFNLLTDEFISVVGVYVLYDEVFRCGRLVCFTENGVL